MDVRGNESAWGNVREWETVGGCNGRSTRAGKSQACPAGTGEYERKKTVLTCPRVEAEQTFYFIVNTD